MSIHKHVLITAGGTGGHVFPALSVANALKESSIDISWLGTERGIESRVVPENGIPIEYIGVEGVRGKHTLSLFLSPFKLAAAVFQSLLILRRLKPDCVLGFGGFVAGPGGIAAKLAGIPLIIHEQNSVAGMTNKWLAKVAKHVLTGFPDVKDMPSSAMWVGNPVREDIVLKDMVNRDNVDQELSASRRLRVLVLGGSQGAYSLNAFLPAIFSKLDVNIEIKHQSGRDKSLEVQAAYQQSKVEANVVEFIEDMASAYQWADMLICRAGAMTVSECCAAGKPALLIPYPYSAGDHQIHNANTMVMAGAGEMILNHKMKSSEMLTTLKNLLCKPERLHEMGLNAHKLHKSNATSNVLNVVREVLDA